MLTITDDIIIIIIIKDCASVAKPLYQLTEHNKTFKWTNQCQDSFVVLHKALVSVPVLDFPDCSRMPVLDIDAIVTKGLGQFFHRSMMMI